MYAFLFLFYRKATGRSRSPWLCTLIVRVCQKIYNICTANKMVCYANKVQQKIEFESIATSSKKVKESTEKLNTAVLGSPTPTQETPQKNICGASPISPWGFPDSLSNSMKICSQSLTWTVMQQQLAPSAGEKAIQKCAFWEESETDFNNKCKIYTPKLKQRCFHQDWLKIMIKSQYVFTGVKWDTFLSLFIFMQTFISRIPQANKLSLQDQLFVTLVKLRLDMPF